VISFRLSPGVKILLGTYFAVFLLQNIVDRWLGGNILGTLGLIPAKFLFEGAIWQCLTYSLLHADPMHLFLNMAILAFVGTDVELSFGPKKFFLFYFIAVAFGAASYLMLPVFNVSGTLTQPLVGASAGIYGLLVVYGVVFGERVMHFMFVVPMKAKVFVMFLALFELMSTAFSSRAAMLSGVAHLGGMLAGVAWLGFEWFRAGALGAKLFKSQFGLKLRSKPRKSKAKLRIVSSDKDDKENPPKIWH